MLTDPVDAADAMRVIALNLVTAMLIATSIVLAVDVLWSRHHWTSQLRMNHQEMKDEMKDADGDPHVKAKRLAIQRQRMKRMMADVPKASVVIVNPTHYAVALRYDAKGAGVPQVVAKGMDHVALRIREVAAEHKVPLVEDVQLARALHACVEVGQFIPRDLFEAVASVIHIIMTRRPGATGLIRRERFSGL
jgi:flagellar biosynthetic protein FlhB